MRVKRGDKLDECVSFLVCVDVGLWERLLVAWLTYAVAGAMQGSLLVMCVMWHVRQRRMGIDDFGDPIPSLDENSPPVFVTRGPGDGAPVQVAVEDALESDVRAGHDGVDGVEAGAPVEEDTPLLGKAREDGDARAGQWLGWLRWRS